MIKFKILVSLLLFSGVSSAQSLEEFFAYAAENHPGIKAEYKEFEAMMQSIPQARSLADPQLSFGYFISPVETRVGPQIAKISLSQMFPWFGTLKAVGDEAALLAEARYQSFLDVRNKLYFDIARAYYPLYEVRKKILIERRNLEILQTYKTIVTDQFENGRGPMADILRIELQIKSTETELSVLNEKLNAQKKIFNLLLNRSEAEIIRIPDSIPLDLSVLQQTDSLNNNPRLRQHELRQEAAMAMERAARKQGLPKIGIGLDYVMIGEAGGPSIGESGRDAIMPMVSMSLPVFRKKYKAAREEAQLMQESWDLRQQQTRNILKGQYYKIRYELTRQVQMISLYQEQIEESQRILDLLYSAYSNTAQDFEEVLGVQQQILQYKMLRIDAEVMYLLNAADYNYITAKPITNED